MIPSLEGLKRGNRGLRKVSGLVFLFARRAAADVDYYGEAGEGGLGADLGFEIFFVVGDEGVGGIGEDDEMGGWDGFVAGVELGGVEDLEAAAAADGRGIGAEHGLHQAVERAGGDALGGAVAHILDGAEKAGHVIAGLRGDEQHGGVIEKE